LNSCNYDLLLITGPTASGKTALASAVAGRLNGEIISADSRQVYRRMNIGTGKDYNDYIVNGVQIPCHLIDIAEPGEKYNVFEYQRQFFNVYELLKQRGVFPVVCGGSGMWVDSVVNGYRMMEVPPNNDLRKQLEEKTIDELAAILASFKKLHNKTDTDTKKRAIRAIEIEHYVQNSTASTSPAPVITYLAVGILPDRERRRENIARRLRQRLDEGMIDEVQNLLNSGIDPETLIYYGLEYKFITLYLTNRLAYVDMVSGLETAICQFAKRQMTWFRGMERKGTKIHWIDAQLPLDDKISIVINLLAGNSVHIAASKEPVLP
jgi:tRNA dimethylallyltransferase